MRISTLALTIAILAASASSLAAKPLERVPQDGTLQQAIQRVSNQGAIEIAAGTYPVPSGGFRVRNPGKSFTIRAAAGAEVVLDGMGSQPIFLVEGRGAAEGRRVAFEGITFRDGRSTDGQRAAGVTVESADAVFVSCTFESNVFDLKQSGGGAVQVRDESRVRFTNVTFTDNTAQARGGAIYVLDSRVDVVWSRFTGNRTNVPGHSLVSIGGAIYVLDSQLSVTASRFEGNEAGWVGGAIYAFGIWREPLSEPATLVTVENSTFVGNVTDPDPCCVNPAPQEGGAIYTEDHTNVVVRSSRFLENVSTWGGALATVRGLFEVHDSVFRGNRGESAAATSAGGTLNLISNDGGGVNRRNAGLVMSDSLLQGRFGSTTVGARQGGCLFAAGDRASLEGNGVPQDGTVADNRIPVVLDNVVFADCDAETEGPRSGQGGALYVSLADLVMSSSLVVDSDALGENSTAGALFSLGDDALRLTGSTFARNSAGARGGAMNLQGAEVEISDCLFLENDVSPGVSEQVQQSGGAALRLEPSDDRDITGVVEGSLFSGNVGIPILDVDSTSGRANRVVYNGNEFHSTTFLTPFGPQVYKNLAISFGGLTVSDLNNLVVPRGTGPGTVKSTVGNQRLTSAPRRGALVAAPSLVLSSAAAGDPAPPTSAFLGYAWSGSGGATLAGTNLPQTSGLLEVTVDGTYPLRVGGTSVANDRVGEGGCSGERVMCLRGEDFLVEVDWRSQDDLGDGNVVGGSDDSGLYWFFEENNWEILVKVLNVCRQTGHFWVFSAATTDVEYTLRVTDRVSGLTKSYFNPLSNAAAAITDTEALAACDTPRRKLGGDTLAPLPAGPLEVPKKADCTADDTGMCLNKSRFRVEVAWDDGKGNTGSGQVVQFGSDDSGLFYFFDEDNWEMLVKLLNGCKINDHFWVFAAATTTVEYTLTVTDTETGATQSYFNRLGNASDAITDTGAFASCP